MKFKCPVCQAVLELESSLQIQCSGCDSVFNKQKILELHEQKQLAKLEAPHISERKKSSLRHVATANLSSRKRSRVQFFMIVGFSLVAVVLVLAIAVVIKSNLSAPGIADTLDAAAQETTIVVEPKEVDLPSLEQSRGNAISEPVVRIPFETLDKPNNVIHKPANKFKSKQAFDRAWFNVKPYLVELYAETPTGPQTATGVVVDSKGWVATSYLAIKGAREIYLRPAKNSALDQQDRLVDKVRGYVAVNPELDLVFLSVNRRLINTFEDLSFDSQSSWVKSQYVIQCQPPTNLFPYPTTETRIDDLALLDQLQDNVKKRLEWRKFSPSVRWIVHRSLAPTRPGAPLVDDQGRVIAINTSAFNSEIETTVALPAAHVLELKNNSDNEVLPLPVGQAEDKNTAEQMAVGETVLPLASSSRSISENLNALGEHCDSFGWWPESDDEADSLRQFIQLLVQSKQDIRADENSEDSEAMLDQIGLWEQKMIDELGVNKSLTGDQQIQFNRKFAGGVLPGEAFIAYAFVSHASMNLEKIAIVGSEPREAIGFEIKGLSDRLITNTEVDWPPMPPDSPWLIVGKKVRGGVVRLVGADDQTTSLSMGQIYFVHQAN